MWSHINPILPTVAFSQLSSNMRCPRDAVSRTANVGTVGKNWLRKRNGGQKWVNVGPHYTCIY